eukprot:7051137-Pyramimonas_sp.AAC.2
MGGSVGIHVRTSRYRLTSLVLLPLAQVGVDVRDVEFNLPRAAWGHGGCGRAILHGQGMEFQHYEEDGRNEEMENPSITMESAAKYDNP